MDAIHPNVYPNRKIYLFVLVLPNEPDQPDPPPTRILNLRANPTRPCLQPRETNPTRPQSHPGGGGFNPIQPVIPNLKISPFFPLIALLLHFSHFDFPLPWHIFIYKVNKIVKFSASFLTLLLSLQESLHTIYL